MSKPYIMHGAGRSSAACRVRIALHLKGLPFREVFLDTAAGEHRKADYLALNPQGLVPTLIAPDGTIVTQSLAILEYLEETEPAIPLLPSSPADRAFVRSLAMIVACDVHPVNNMRIRNHVKALQPGDPDAVLTWTEKWSHAGFVALEENIKARRAKSGGNTANRFCFGDRPTIADACLVPHVFNARGLGHDISAFPVTAGIAEACNALEAFKRAHPEAQNQAPMTA
jgi:maleylacetoacetate isomerase